MNAIVSILLTAAGDLAVPIIKRVLSEKIGGASGEIAGKVIDAIAGKLGLSPRHYPPCPVTGCRTP